MELKKIEGIIISDRDYGESSKILNVLTREYGIIGIHAKGCKKLKSGLASKTGKLSYGYFHVYYKKDKLSTLITIDIINELRTIKTDITALSYVVYLTKLTEQIVKQEFSELIYDIYINAVLKINEKIDYLGITNIVELQYLDILGIKPILDTCCICEASTDIITLSADDGGYICSKCRTNQKIVTPNTIKFIRMFYYLDIKKVSKFEINEISKNEINEFITIYYEKYSGLYLKSRNFMSKLTK